MVKKTAVFVTGMVVVLLIASALRLLRSFNCDECDEFKSALIAEPGLKPQDKPLTGEEVEECFHAFEGICNAYSDLRFETMQEFFCGISNKVARLGKDRIDKLISPLTTQFREAFWSVDRNLLDFATVPEFDRYLKTNITAVKILGCAIVAKNFYDNVVLDYDMVAFRGIEGYLRKFRDDGNEQLALSAQTHLDEWKEHLASGQSLTRLYLQHQFRFFLRLPRWQAEDMGMKSERDWITYVRNNALKFFKQCYNVEPKWLDEDFPLPQDCDDGMSASGKYQK